MIVLFLNHNIQQCGVYQYGKRIYDIIKKDKDITYIYKEITNYEEYTNLLKENDSISYIIYNYHSSTMPWLKTQTIQKIAKNVGIPHESDGSMFDITCNIDPNATKTITNFPLPRPIFEGIDFNEMGKSLENSKNMGFIKAGSELEVPIFGSFGFGFTNKGFDKVLNFVNEQYNEAIIKLVIPNAFFSNPNTAAHMINICKNIVLKEGIKLMVTNEFFSEEEILFFLHSNTMNIFLYDLMLGRGISSTIDYALSVKKPLGISDSYMFRNIYSDDISLYKNKIDICLNNSINYCSQFLEKYSHDNMINVFRSIII